MLGKEIQKNTVVHTVVTCQGGLAFFAKYITKYKTQIQNTKYKKIQNMKPDNDNTASDGRRRCGGKLDKRSSRCLEALCQLVVSPRNTNQELPVGGKYVLIQKIDSWITSLPLPCGASQTQKDGKGRPHTCSTPLCLSSAR